jgi:hypothetical protein
LSADQKYHGAKGKFVPTPDILDHRPRIRNEIIKLASKPVTDANLSITTPARETAALAERPPTGVYLRR